MQNLKKYYLKSKLNEVTYVNAEKLLNALMSLM